MSVPWILASRELAGTKWLDDQDVALQGAPVRSARSQVSGELLRVQGLPAGPVSGRSSVSGSLAVRHRMSAEPAQGSSTVSANLGYVLDTSAMATGSSTVSGELMIGVAQFLEAVVNSSSEVATDEQWGDDGLSVKRVPRVTGEQVDPVDPVSGPSRSARGNEKGRRYFSPRSSGRVGSKSVTP